QPLAADRERFDRHRRGLLVAFAETHGRDLRRVDHQLGFALAPQFDGPALHVAIIKLATGDTGYSQYNQKHNDPFARDTAFFGLNKFVRILDVHAIAPDSRSRASCWSP